MLRDRGGKHGGLDSTFYNTDESASKRDDDFQLDIDNYFRLGANHPDVLEPSIDQLDVYTHLSDVCHSGRGDSTNTPLERSNHFTDEFMNFSPSPPYSSDSETGEFLNSFEGFDDPPELKRLIEFRLNKSRPRNAMGDESDDGHRIEEESPITYIETKNAEETVRLLQLISRTEGMEVVSLTERTDGTEGVTGEEETSSWSTCSSERSSVGGDILNYPNFLADKALVVSPIDQQPTSTRVPPKSDLDLENAIATVFSGESKVFQEAIAAVGRILQRSLMHHDKDNIDIEILIREGRPAAPAPIERKSGRKGLKSRSIPLQFLAEALTNAQNKRRRKAIFKHRRFRR